MAGNSKSFHESAAERLAGLDEGRPIVMINLLRYRDRAAYPAGYDAEPCSGREAYRRYGQAAIEFITAVGGQVIWEGSPKAVLIGPEEEHWHKVLLVRYPSREAFLAMVANPDYRAIAVHRTAALEDSRLIATLPAS